MYNPIPLNVSYFGMVNRNNGTNTFTGGRVLVSDNGGTFTQVCTFTNSTTGKGATWVINVTDNYHYYKYWRIEPTSVSTSSGTNTSMAEIQIHATYLKSGAIDQEHVWAAHAQSSYFIKY